VTHPRRPRWEIETARVEAEFRARLAELGVSLVAPEYLGYSAPHPAICSAGHECEPRPNNIRRGGRACRTCSGRDSAASEAAFRLRVAELGGTVLELKWLSNRGYHQVRCPAGHLAKVQPNRVQQGGGICPVCAGRSVQAAETEFKARLAKLGATLLETEWLGSQTPHRIRCAQGHEVTTTLSQVRRRNSCCRTCARRDSDTAAREFRDRLTELGAILLEPAWLGNRHPHRVMCASGHECAPRPESVQQGQGICRYCAGKAWDVFYVVADDSAALLKFGITTGSGRRRLNAHRRAGFVTVHRLLTGLPGDTAPRLERDILATLRLAGEEPVRGREYFPARVTEEVLRMVDSYPIPPGYVEGHCPEPGSGLCAC
jgi:hypothetical protein